LKADGETSTVQNMYILLIYVFFLTSTDNVWNNTLPPRIKYISLLTLFCHVSNDGLEKESHKTPHEDKVYFVQQ
jgi:hypothetical protein